MRINIKNILVTSVLVLAYGCYFDRPLLTTIPIETISDRLDKSIPILMKKNNVAGLSVVVIRNGEVSIAKSFGYADTETKRKVDRHTVFRAASLGKPIFAYIVASLARQEVIDLDTPLYAYLGEEVVRGDPRSKKITARMVLTHTTGLPNLDGKTSNTKFLFDPGAGFEYSGHAYLYLQKVIEKVTKKGLNELATELVFKPLNMNESSFKWEDRYRGTISSSYDSTGEVISSKEEPERGRSAWSLFTTIEDYARFVTFTIKTSGIRGSVIEEMLSSNVDVAKSVKWSLGWGLQDTDPNDSFWHWGSTAGFRHYVVGYPSEQIGVIVMSNSWWSFKMVDDVMVQAIGGDLPSYDWF